ncbi:MAG: hypothetical protein ACLT40_00505 [Fusobacterium sp.]
MTMNNTKTNGTTTNNGGKAMTKAAILRQLKEEFPELEINELKEMAQEEYEAQFETTQQLKTEEKQETTTEEDEMDKFLEFMYKEVTARGAVTSKVASTLIYKYINEYGKDVDKIARYVAAFLNYYTTQEGTEHARRLGKDILMLIGIQFGKNLLGEFETLVELLEVGETLVKYKTGFDGARAIVGGVKYAKKNQQNITTELLEYGNKQKLTSMAFGAIDELLDQE